MPLLNGHPVKLLAGPAPADDSSASGVNQGWQIRFTGETFDDYEKYLDRVAFYRKPQFTCNTTGQQNLPYEQALLSERAEQHRATGIGFSDQLICEMLTFLSHSTLSISMAIDALFYRFQYDFFVGEHIDVRYPDTQGAMYECFVVGISSLQPMPPMGSFGSGSYASDAIDEDFVNPTKVAIDRLGNNAENIVLFEQRKHRMYTVRLYDIDGLPIEDSDITVPATELSRSRNVFTKVALRQFLDETMQRSSSRVGSPWVVRPEWRERFRIPYMYGGEARLLRTSSQNSRAIRHPRDTASDTASHRQHQHQPPPPPHSQQQAAPKHEPPVKQPPPDPYASEREIHVKPVRKFPIDDYEFMQLQHVKWNEGILWALRHKLQKDAKPNGNRKITEFFAVKKDPAKDTPSDAEDPEDPEDEQVNEVLARKWPVPLCEWQVPLPLVSRVLSTYMFISCFSTPLKLTPYSLDYFESALAHNTGPSTAVTPPNSVYSESALALLNAIAYDRSRRAASSTSLLSRIEQMIQEQDAEVSEDEAELELLEVATDAGKMDVVAADADVLPPPAPLVALTKPRQRTASRPVSSMRSGRRKQPRSALANSSSIAASSASDASDSASESDASTTVPDSPRKPPRRGGRSAAAKHSNGRQRTRKPSNAGSRAASDAGSDSEDMGGDDRDMNGDAEMAEPADSATGNRSAAGRANGHGKSANGSGLASMRPHALLRHLSRTWASQTPGEQLPWACVLAGWILEARADYPSDLDNAYQALWNAPELTVETLESVLWASLDTAERRLVLLELLVGECTGTDDVREYLDQNAESSVELRRERIEVRRDLKRITESLSELDRVEAEENLKNVASVATGASREQGRKDKEAELQRQKERRKLGELERNTQRRLDALERELRRTAVGRLMPLGQDRYLTRYYFLDGIGSCPLTGACTGRVLVQPAPRAEVEEAMAAQPNFVRAMQALEIPSLWTGGSLHLDKLLGKADRALVEHVEEEHSAAIKKQGASAPIMADLAHEGELWGYYATSRQVDSLRRWLEQRGRREAALAAELELVQMALSGSMRKRCQTLEAGFEARVRTREQICDRISALLDGKDGAAEDGAASNDDDEAEVARLHEELAVIDRTSVPRALLPPGVLVEEQLGDPSQEPKEDPAGAQDAVAGQQQQQQQANGNSSRASSVEASSVDLFVQQAYSHVSSKRFGSTRPMRGRRPKGLHSGRRARPKTFIERFLEYENTFA
ncbi:hypothetical protein GGI07_000263 [Coemansia sp. Benny D115]|nr:hypothetical protein GGI07_000263 [Coemansia sp. Benny D115]